MKKIFLVLFIFIPMLAHSQANWIRIAGDDKFTMYIDSTTISKKDNYVKAWFLSSYVLPQTFTQYPYKSWQSSVVLDYFDCQENSSATNQLLLYGSEMGQGEIVFTQKWPITPQAFSELVPGSYGITMKNSVCWKK